MKSVTRVGLGVCVYLGALLAGVPGALAGHLRVEEAVRDTDTNFILNVPVSVQKLGDGVTSVTVQCSLSAGGHVIGGGFGAGSKAGGGARLTKEVSLDRFTGTGSGTVTFRLHVFDPQRSSVPIGPVSATCRLLFDGVGVITTEGVQGPVVGTPPASSSSKAGVRRAGESAYVKPGATIEVSGNFP